MKRILATCSVFIIPILLFAQNRLIGFDTDVAQNQDFYYKISLSNTTAVSAIQFDVNIPDDKFEIKSNHSLSSRAEGFTVSVGKPAENIVRVVIFSFNNSNISMGEGEIVALHLRSKTKPSTNTLSTSNIIVADVNNQAVEMSTTDGVVTVKGSIMVLNTSSIDFGRVPLGQQSQRSISISNSGNQDLILSGTTAANPFVVTDVFPISISPGSTRDLNVQLITSAKYNSSTTISFTSNDLDGLRGLQKTTLAANVYAVNEVHLQSVSGRSGYEVTVPIKINNMEPFVGFQFNINLPAQASYVEGTFQLSTRTVDHTVSAKTNGSVLTVTAFSPGLKPFLGNDGDIATFKLLLNGNGGNYYLSLNEAILADADAKNIISDYYNAYVGIKSPRVYLSQNNINYGAMSILDKSTKQIQVNNFGDDTLKIASVSSNESAFKLTETVTSMNIAPYQNGVIGILFDPQVEKNYNGKLLIQSNDPNNNVIEVQLSGSGYEPNTLEFKNQSTTKIKDHLSHFYVNLENYTDITAVQFEINIPNGFILKTDSCKLSVRSDDHVLAINSLSPSKAMVLIYSPGLKKLLSSSGNIIDLAFEISPTTVYGIYPFTLENVVLSDMLIKNRIQTVSSGVVIYENYKPVAVAGDDQFKNEGEFVELDGYKSYDINNDQLNYKWTSLNGVELNNSFGAKTTFTTPFFLKDSVLNFTLSVSDGDKTSSLDTVKVFVTHKNLAPIAIIGNISDIFEGDSLQLNGSNSFDPEGHALKYYWKTPKEVVIQDSTIFNPTITVPYITSDTSFTLIFKVFDGYLFSPEVKLIINVKNKIMTLLNNVETNIIITPNPTSDFINVTGIKKGTIQINNLNGKIVLTKEFQGNNRINLISLPPGLYLYKVISDAGIGVGKLIKH